MQPHSQGQSGGWKSPGTRGAVLREGSKHGAPQPGGRSLRAVSEDTPKNITHEMTERCGKAKVTDVTTHRGGGRKTGFAL